MMAPSDFKWLILGICCAWLPSTAAWGQTDTIPPQLHCKPAVNTLLPPTGYLQLQLGDFIDTAFDNSGIPPELGFRKPCTGEGFPGQTPLTYLYTGFFQVDVWARDGQGNTSKCFTQLYIGDLGNGPISHLNIQVEDPELRPVGGVALHLETEHCVYGQFSETSGTSDVFPAGITTMQAPEPGAQVNLCAWKEQNALNGITTYDMVLIQKHISGVEPFGSPYQRLAADANLDGFVDQRDLLLLRDLILGIRRELPGGFSWRIFPADHPFDDSPSVVGPIAAPCIQYASYPDLQSNLMKFIAIKIGDVNFSADPSH